MARGNKKVGYADLFAGPGIYADDEGSTHNSIPALVCEAAVREDVIGQKVHLWFNDGDRDNYKKLQAAIAAIPGVEKLRYAPTIHNKIIDSSWASRMAKLKIPTLVFLDPCGYKGLSLRLVKSVLGGFGNDCIFFFNYSRINMKLDLQIMNNSIDEFFEPERANALRQGIQGKNPDEREELILAAVGSAIKEAAGIPLFFKFLSDQNRTSHHLVFASKDRNATTTMKRILNGSSSTVVEGVGSGEHDPRAKHLPASLFGGLYEVENRLLSTFGDRRVRFDILLEEESQTRFTESNYRDAILNLEREGHIVVDPPAETRPYQAGREKRTLPKSVYISFGRQKDHGK